MALSDLARDRNGAVIGRYRLVHSGGLSQTLTHGITFVSGVCEVNAKGNERALARVVASLGPKLTVTRLWYIADATESSGTIEKFADGTVITTSDRDGFREVERPTEPLTDEQKQALLFVSEEALEFMGAEAQAYVAAVKNDRERRASVLHASGLSWAQVGDKMGVSKETARQLAKRHEAEAA